MASERPTWGRSALWDVIAIQWMITLPQFENVYRLRNFRMLWNGIPHICSVHFHTISFDVKPFTGIALIACLVCFAGDYRYYAVQLVYCVIGIDGIQNRFWNHKRHPGNPPHGLRLWVSILCWHSIHEIWRVISWVVKNGHTWHMSQKAQHMSQKTEYGSYLLLTV